jgi:hypothetical protein
VIIESVFSILVVEVEVVVEGGGGGVRWSIDPVVDEKGLIDRGVGLEIEIDLTVGVVGVAGVAVVVEAFGVFLVEEGVPVRVCCLDREVVGVVVISTSTLNSPCPTEEEETDPCDCWDEKSCDSWEELMPILLVVVVFLRPLTGVVVTAGELGPGPGPGVTLELLRLLLKGVLTFGFVDSPPGTITG